MKLIDDKGKIFGFINYIDLIFLLAVVFLVGRFVLVDSEKGIPRVTDLDNSKEIETVYLISGVKDVSIDSVEVGDVFKSIETNSSIGEVTKKETKPASIMTTDENGSVVYSEIPDRFDMYLTIKGVGQVTEGDIKVGNTEVRIGKTSLIQSRMNRFSAIIYGINYN